MHRNSLLGASPAAPFLYNLTKNLTAHLHHQLCAVLPKITRGGDTIMIDLQNLAIYRENNRIEAKKATGGLPDSVWETYSAFANTLGGVILLGVEEYPDKSLHPVDLPDPDWIITDFWETVNDPAKVSVNLLGERDVRIHAIDGKRIIVITVPRAQSSDMPVFINNDPLTGTYLRNGEGDYRCTPDEVFSMLRSSRKGHDMRLLEELPADVIDPETLCSYRMRMSHTRPGHVLGELENDEFLRRIGAVGTGHDGNLHPTAAGLLMFGNEYEIVRAFPAYFLDYREDEALQGGCRIMSSSGEWSGNLYDFYFRVQERFLREFGAAGDDAPVYKALREALANCVLNADYSGRQGLVIHRSAGRITFSNPGRFLIGIEAAKTGGISDPVNPGLVKMFSLIDIGSRTGSGIPGIFRVWNQRGWQAPVISESFHPERIKVTLEIGNTADKQTISNVQKDMIIDYLTDHVTGDAASLAGVLGVKPSRARRLLQQLTEEGIVITDEAEEPLYSLK
ncbi:MAG: putative DNA binding domain-containing protein [Oscillospiraceae bacterium]|nr:putative DNA binding domain-containing protein [Oscillospiraceae bacterium]